MSPAMSILKASFTPSPFGENALGYLMSGFGGIRIVIEIGFMLKHPVVSTDFT